ncbi:MAG: FAD-dependent oxidoreductase [Anaerolineae bacterium]|nr:FAD-dependent oxidoreductase [Anaerolineae bacterium]
MLAACKNIGTRHLTNDAYRLHPVEWNVGESAGALAAHCCDTGARPHQVRGDLALLRRFQYVLLQRGVPLAWAIDVPASHPLFVPTQMLLAMGAIPSAGPRFDSLELRLDDPLSGREAAALLEAVGSVPGVGASPPLPQPWIARPDEIATRSQALRALQGVNSGEVTLSDFPTLGELCAAWGPALHGAYAPDQEDP